MGIVAEDATVRAVSAILTYGVSDDEVVADRLAARKIGLFAFWDLYQPKWRWHGRKAAAKLWPFGAKERTYHERLSLAGGAATRLI
jgi:hypothetical protein